MCVHVTSAAFKNVNNRILIYKNHIIKNSFNHLHYATAWQAHNEEWNSKKKKLKQKHKKHEHSSEVLVSILLLASFILSYWWLRWWRVKHSPKSITVNREKRKKRMHAHTYHFAKFRREKENRANTHRNEEAKRYKL